MDWESMNVQQNENCNRYDVKILIIIKIINYVLIRLCFFQIFEFGDSLEKQQKPGRLSPECGGTIGVFLEVKWW